MIGKLMFRSVVYVSVALAIVSSTVAPASGNSANGERPMARPLEPHSVTKSLRAVADASIDHAAPGTNRGSEGTLYIWFDPPFPGGDQVLYSLIRFDLAAEVPAAAIIESATLGVYLNAIGNTTEMLPVGVSAHAITQPWFESVVTWNNQPAVGPAAAIASINSPDQAWKKWTVTNMVRAWQDGTSPNHGIELRGPTTGTGIGSYHLFFNSREAGKGPYLDVVYCLPATRRVFLPYAKK